MDIISLELGIALLLIFALPIVYIIRKQNKTKNVFIKKLKKVHPNAVISNIETLGKKALITDSVNGMLHYGDFSNAKENIITIAVNTIKLPEVEKVIDKQNKSTLEVKLHIAHDTHKKLTIVFFDDDTGNDPQIALHQANLWKAAINEMT